MADIFVSYASADRERAQAIGKLLAARGYGVWWDRTIPPGEIFDEVIQTALNAAKCVVVLWSATSVRSNWVKTEAAEAAGRNILMPALIENVPLPIEFKRIQSANLTGWTGNPDDPEFQNLLAGVDRLVTSPARAVPASSGAKPSGADSAATGESRRLSYVAYACAVGLIVAAIAYILYPKTAVHDVDKQSKRNQFEIPEKRIDATVPAPPPSARAAQATVGPPGVALPSAKRVNLLAKENGGQLVAAPDTIWSRAIIDYEDAQAWAGSGEAVFAFKDERPATFDTFALLITQTSDGNVNEFELLAGNQSATGRFESIGQFATQNVRLMKSPYQEFKFPAVKAKYLKVRLLTDHKGRKGSMALHKFQLLGTTD